MASPGRLLLVPPGTPWLDHRPGIVIDAAPDYHRRLQPEAVEGLLVLMPAAATTRGGPVPDLIGSVVVNGLMGSAQTFDALSAVSDAAAGGSARVEISMVGECGDACAVFFNSDTGCWDRVVTVSGGGDGNATAAPIPARFSFRRS